MIRAMNKSDISEIAEIYYQTRRQAFSWLDANHIKLSDFFRDTKEERMWLAEIDGRIAGFISVSELDNFIHHLYVLPVFTGQGLGTKLLNVCLSNIGRPARLKCVTANTKALYFYKSKGWLTISLGVSEDGEYQLMETR